MIRPLPMLLIAGLFVSSTLYAEPVAVGYTLVRESGALRNNSNFGRVEAIRDTDIRTRVSGTLDTWHVREGDHVSRGTILAEVDPRVYQANVRVAEAEVAKAQAALELARLEQQRLASLLKKQVISQSESDKATAMRKDAEAGLAAAEAALELMCKRSLSRTAFGKQLAYLGANFDIIADARMEIEMARLLCLKAAWMMDQGDPRAAAPWISKIKVVAPIMALKVVDEAIQLHGAGGISQDTPLAAYWMHLRTLRLADGPDAVHRRQVARAELRKHTQEKI